MLITYEHTPRIPTGSHLLRVHGVDGLPLPSYGGGALPIPNLGHYMNDLTANHVHIFGPT